MILAFTVFFWLHAHYEPRNGQPLARETTELRAWHTNEVRR